jgi:hypothetical protein
MHETWSWHAYRYALGFSSEKRVWQSSSVPQWLDEIVASYEEDSQAKDLISKLSVQPSAVPHFSLVNGDKV